MDTTSDLHNFKPLWEGTYKNFTQPSTFSSRFDLKLKPKYDKLRKDVDVTSDFNT